MAYKGLLYIRCEKCGKEKTFFTNERIKEAYCNECGAHTQFGKLVPLWLHCECGERRMFKTNIKEPIFDAKCSFCGAPVAVEWKANKHVYATIREE